MIKTKNISAFAAGLLIGGIVGAILALLYAPQSGEGTRTLLERKSGDVKDQVTIRAKDARERASKVIYNARGKVTDLTQTTRERASELLHRGEHAPEQAVQISEETPNLSEPLAGC